MSLSVIEAAREAASTLALVVGSHRLTFGELAGRVEARLDGLRGREAPVALVASPDLDTLVTIYACLELGVPFAPVQARLTRDERDRRLRECAGFRPVGREGEEAALAFLYTSGTSGQGRAIELSRRAFAAAAEASGERLGWRDGDRWLLALSLAHVGGLSILVRCLLARRPMVVATAPSFAPGEILRLLWEEHVTICSLVPTQLSKLLAQADGGPPPELRAILLGGASPSRALLEEARERGWPVLTTYGLTEACAQVATQCPGAPVSGAGEPLAGVAVRIVDGAIEIRSPSLMTARHPGGLPPALTPDGWFRTGDLGRLDPAGALSITGRRDEVIVTGGEKVVPGEVEAVLEGCAGVRAACVFGIDDTTWGRLVAAAIVPAAWPPDLAAVERHVRERLASFQRPRRVAFLEALPSTPAGKIDRAAVARESAERWFPLQRSG
ncbi:MAG: class I adenylate-forming enzyme family protein [Myxococcales bacterium]